MTMSTAVDFHSQIASIMEVLANAAVVEICKVVDDSYAVVQLEMSRSHKESECLRRRVKLLELQIARYRAERGRATDGASGSRFPGVRLLGRHSRDSLAGPSSQSRTRFLNRGPGAVQKDQTLKGDQNPIQEVVTTIKIEAAEARERNETELLIIKVEEATETTEETPPVPGTITTTSEDDPPQRESSTSQLSSRRTEWEDQRCLDTSASPGPDLKIIQVQEDTPETNSSVGRQQGWQKSETPHVEEPTCSTFKAAHSSQRQNQRGLSPGFFPDLTKPQSDAAQVNSLPNLNLLTVLSHPPSAESRGDGMPSGVTAKDEECDEEKPVFRVTLQYQPTQCEQVGETSRDVKVKMNATPGDCITGSDVSERDFSNQQTPHVWCRNQPVDSGGRQERPQQLSNSQSLEVRSDPSLRFACPYCPRRFTHLSELLTHERIHTGEKPFHCSQCGNNFSQSSSLKRHQRVHTGERPFPCSFCGKKFSNSASLKLHLRVHTGERPFPCPHCGKQFANSANLKAHQTVHTGEKRFHCFKCGKNFSFHSNLSRHLSLQHAAD